MTVDIPVEGLFEREVCVTVSCNACGKPISGSWWRDEIVIDPCETCMDNAKDEGYEEGANECE